MTTRARMSIRLPPAEGGGRTVWSYPTFRPMRAIGSTYAAATAFALFAFDTTAGTAQPQATALVVGQVVDGVSGRPLAGSIVAISGNASVQGRPRILTRGDGRFVFTNLAAGSYGITASRDGYTDGSYGRARPGGPSRSLQLSGSERSAEVKILLWRNAAISGTIVDKSGERLVGATVKVFRRTIVAGQREFHQAAAAHSDDRGIFRFGSLVPGHYIVGSVPSYVSLPPALAGNVQPGLASGSGVTLRMGEARVALDTGVLLPPAGEHPMIYTPVYHPFSPVLDGATVVTLAPGGEYEHADLRILPVPAVQVSGQVLGPDGPVIRGLVRMQPEGTTALSLEGEWLSAPTDRRGRFVFAAVPTGQYAIRFLQPMVRPTGPTSQERDVEWANLPLSVGKEPIENLTVVAQRGVRIRGQVDFDGSGDTAAALSRTSITIEPVDPENAITVSGPGVRPDASGQFTTAGLPGGRYYIRVANSPSGWMFVGATLEGRDVTDVPLTVSGDTTGVSVRFTKRWSGVSGTVLGASGPDPSLVVIVFPTDPVLWGPSGANSRRTRSMQVNAAGSFAVNVPPGDYYVAALRDDIGEDWRDPAVLETISRSATRAAIHDGEQRTLQLRTVRVQ